MHSTTTPAKIELMLKLEELLQVFYDNPELELYSPFKHTVNAIYWELNKDEEVRSYVR